MSHAECRPDRDDDTDDDDPSELPTRGVHSQSRHRRSARTIANETIVRLRLEALSGIPQEEPDDDKLPPQENW